MGRKRQAWLANAAAMGYKTSQTPIAGAIVVTSESRYYGHVAYVESVTAATITISEMNYTGWARKSIRVLDRDSGVIRGLHLRQITLRSSTDKTGVQTPVFLLPS